MPMERRGLTAQHVLANTGGRGAMTKAPINLQDLRRRLYVKAKAEPIGLITLGVNCAGARSAGNLHATCDVAGAGNQLTVPLVRHSQRKRGATDRPDLRSDGASPRPYQPLCVDGSRDRLLLVGCARLLTTRAEAIAQQEGVAGRCEAVIGGIDILG
jgi:hypothetical protein